MGVVSLRESEGRGLGEIQSHSDNDSQKEGVGKKGIERGASAFGVS